MHRLVLLVGLTAVTLSCSGGSDPIPEPQQRHSSLGREMNPAVPAADLSRLVSDNTDFGLALHREIARVGANTATSPFSISEALAMTFAGAEGQTAAEIAKALRFSLPPGQLHPGFDALDLAITSRAHEARPGIAPLSLRIANSVWAQSDYPILPSFLDTLAVNYGAGVTLVDFAHDSDSARFAINGWVAGRTEDRIKELLPQGALDATTRLVLTNAIYFKAEWRTPLDPNQTYPSGFRLPTGGWTSVPTMHATGVMHGVAHDSYSAVELPYDGGQLSFVAIAPAEGTTLADFEASLSSADLDRILASMTSADSQLALPKFTLQTESIDLSQVFQGMGMAKAFDPAAAEFGAMVDLAAVQPERVFIQKVFHKAFVSVAEKGTEAAAATAVVMGADAGCIGPVDPPQRRRLTFDRPFLFLVRDVETGTLLFLGQVADPRL